MKKYIYALLAITCLAFLNACSDDDKSGPGNPILESKSQFTAGLFGDSIPFVFNVSDDLVPLSTLKAHLYFSDDLVSEVVIRTKTNGEYSGKIFVPFLANVPNGTAKLKFLLQNVNLTIVEQEYDLPLMRPDYPYLTFVTKDAEYRMEPAGLYTYEVTKDFSAKMPGYIKAPAMQPYGNELTFGWENNVAAINSTTNIPFSNFPGQYAISFNTFNYEVSPFVIAYTINGTALGRVDDNNYTIDLDLAQGQEISVEGIDNFSDWWIDSDYFTGTANNLTFAPISGKYRISANFEAQYLRVETMNGNNIASLQSDGTGAIWIIGDNIGKPNLTSTVGWNPSAALCMAPIGGKKYQTTVVAGKNITPESINFKFFHQKDWGGEFKHEALSTESDVVFVGNGSNGRDSGNLGIVEGKTLTEGKTYVFTVDLSAGNDKAVLTVVQK